MKKKLVLLLIIATISVLFAGCTPTASPENNQPNSETPGNATGSQSDGTNDYDNKKVLTVYFSRSGNTEQLAEMIANSINTDVFVIDPVVPYDDTYEATIAEARREREENARPEYIGTVENMDDYDTILLGYPIWGGVLPMIVHTFLEDYDLAGKTIYPFWSSNHGGYFNTINVLESALPNSTIGEGLSVRGSEVENAQESINDWLATIGLMGDTGASGSVGDSNYLIAYFTWADNTIVENPALVDVDAVTSASVLPPGNTGLIAQFIQEVTGADVYKIIVTEPYSSNYNECLARATEEHNANARPALTASVPNIDDYDVIFLGFPNWYYSTPMAILTFIDEHDLSGKTIIPFCAHGTGGLAQSITHITDTLPDDVTILEAFGVYRPNVATAQNDVIDWLDRLGIGT